MANQSCSGSTIIANRHYKNNAFVMTQNARCILTMENMAYSDFMKIMKMSMSSECTLETQICTPKWHQIHMLFSGEHAELDFEQYA